jgi:hypothetical protein
LNGWPSDTWVLASVTHLRWAWRTDDERQEIVLALYCAWPGWDPDKGPWLPWAARYVRWWLREVRRKERRAVRQTTITADGEVTAKFVPRGTTCRLCPGELFTKGLCQRCYRRSRRKQGKDK